MGRRIWYAEDIAFAFERMQTESIREVSKKMGVSYQGMRDMMYKARKNGFDAYPLRGNK